MKSILAKICLGLCLVLAATGCKNSKALMPNISGKAGEVIVVIDRENWEGNLGNAVRELLGGECPYLIPREPLFTLSNVTPSGFGELFKIHRNILIFNINPQNQKEGVNLINDAWAHPQCIVQIDAFDKESALNLLKENTAIIVNTIEQAERDRNIGNAIRYENAQTSLAVRDMIGGNPHFPDGYKVRKKTDNFIWVAYDSASILQDILVYRYPANGNESDFKLETLIANRNAILKDNVPSTYEGSYMTTDESYLKPTLEFIRFRGRQFAQIRGWWDVHGGWMGGPFVEHAFYSRDGKEIIVLDAFVHAPGHDKRQLLRQVESIIYSFEWAGTSEETKKEGE